MAMEWTPVAVIVLIIVLPMALLLGAFLIPVALMILGAIVWFVTLPFVAVYEFWLWAKRKYQNRMR